MTPAAILDRCRLFGRMTPTAKTTLYALATAMVVPAREVIFRQGDPCPGLFVVGTGLVRVYKLAPNGKEHILHLAGPGATFAEAAVIGGFPCPAFAEAAEPTELAFIPAEAFMGFLRQDHQSCIDLLVGLSAWLHHVVDLLEDVVLRDALGRVARYLVERIGPGGHVELPSSRKHLASHLNLTPETMSRTLRRLLDEGLIVDDEAGLRVLATQRLREVADGVV